jgi:hypothetical protein
MACCSSCYCTPCSCAPITGEADAPQCLPTGSELKLDSIGGFDEYNCPKALVPFRGFDSGGNAIINESIPYQTGFIQQDTQGKIFWTNRPEIPLAEDDIGIQIAGDQANPANSIPNLVGVSSDGAWTKIVARTGQAASTMKWYPTTGFTLEADPNDLGVCTTLSVPLTLDPTISTYILTIESSAVFATGVSVMIDAREFVVSAVLSPTQIRVTPAFTPSAVEVIPAGTFACGVGFRPVSGITSSYVDTLTGSLAGASASLTFPADVSSQKVPGLFWRDQTGKVCFLAAPVDGAGVVVANQVLKTPSSPTLGAANIPTFVSIPGGYTWLATPSTIAPFTYNYATGGPPPGSVTYNVTPLAPVGSKMVILDIKANYALMSAYGGTSVEFTINGLYAAYLTAGASFATPSDTNQIIVPIELSPVLTMNTVITGVINNNYSQTVRVLGFIG